MHFLLEDDSSSVAMVLFTRGAKTPETVHLAVTEILFAASPEESGRVGSDDRESKDLGEQLSNICIQCTVEPL